MADINQNGITFMEFLAWVFLSGLILISFDTLLFARVYRGWQRFLGTFFFFYGQIVLTEMLLGFMGVLTAMTVFATNLLIAAAVLWFVRRLYGKTIFRKYVISVQSALKIWVKSLKDDPLFVALLVLACVVIGWIIFLGILFPVTDFDGNAYHMSFIAQAIHDHRIHEVPTSILWLTGYPKGGELIQMWNVIIPGSDALADLAQVPFIVLGMVSIYGLCMRFGVAIKDARFVSLLFLFLPVMINQAKTTYVDIMLSSIFLAALAWVTTKKAFSKLDFVILGSIFSLLLAIKPTGILFVLACLPFLFFKIVTIKNKRILPDYKLYLERTLLVLIPMLPGLYWYIKDLIVYGTPFYPFGVTVLGKNIFPGQTFQDFISTAFTNSYLLPDNMPQRLWFVWTEQKDWFGCLYNYDATFTGLGPIWFILLLPSLLFGIVLAIKRRQYLLLAVAAVVGIVFLIYPANFYARYVMFAAAMGLVLFGLVCTVFAGVARGFARLVAVWLALVVVATTFTLCNFPPAAVRDQLNSTRAGHARETATYINTVGASYTFLENRLKAGDTVAYDSSPTFVYPLWKPDFSNNVVYVPAKNAEEWYKKLKQQNVDYIFAAIGSKEYKWLQKDRPFSSIYKDTSYEIYEIR